MFYMSPTNVEQKVKTLKTNKAVGPNSIPTKILKTYSKSLSKPLSELINLSFAQAKFLTILKIAKVMPIHKQGDKSECDNYRPLSLISNISKLLEKLVHERLYSFLEKEKLLFEGQYGFRNKRSTTDALTNITERMRDACDKGYYACGAFLDFRKAFDAVNHEILLHQPAHVVPGTSPEGPLKVLTSGIYRGPSRDSLGTNTKTDDLRKNLFLVAIVLAFTYLFLLFTRRTNIQKF